MNTLATMATLYKGWPGAQLPSRDVFLLRPRCPFGVAVDHAQVRRDRSIRREPPLLPVLQCIEIEDEPQRELLLREVELRPHRQKPLSNIHGLGQTHGTNTRLPQLAYECDIGFDGWKPHKGLASFNCGFDGPLCTQHR